MKNLIRKMMIAAALMCAAQVSAQTATDPGEGLRAAVGSTSGTTSVSWWGKAGRTYFVQTCVTLMEADWRYVPVIESGTGAAITWNLSSSAERGFVRLVYTDQVYSGAVGDADFDGDGLSNALEIALNLRTDPFKTDTDGDFVNDLLETQLGTNATNRDSDGDGFSDGEEQMDGTDALNAASNQKASGYETGKVAFPVTLLGFYKYVNNDWYGGYAAPPSYVTWGGSARMGVGSESYNTFTPKYVERLGWVFYPFDSAGGDYPYWDFGADTAYTSASHHLNATVGRATLFYSQVRLGTSSFSYKQPWDVAGLRLAFSFTRKHDGSDAEYTGVQMHQFTIPALEQVSPYLEMEPAMPSNAFSQMALINPQVSLWGLGLDKVSSQEGEIDHWLMIPANGSKIVVLRGITNSSHSLIYKPGGGITASADLVEDGAIRTANHGVNYATLYAEESGESGFIEVGVANGLDGTPVMAQNKPLLRVAVLPHADLKVTVHPINLSGPNATTLTHLPTAAQLKSYLDYVFGQQANMYSNVTVLEPVTLNWDSGIGYDYDAFTANNGVLDLLNTRSGYPDYPAYNTSPEEFLINSASPADAAADVNVYFVAAPSGIEHSSYYGPGEPERNTAAHMRGSEVIGWAGKAPSLVRGGSLWIWDYPAGWGRPDHKFTIAHEIVHYVAGVGHSIGKGEGDNHMPNSDNEMRLMSGKIGPKRQSSPPQMIKFEWARLNMQTGITGNAP